MIRPELIKLYQEAKLVTPCTPWVKLDGHKADIAALLDEIVILVGQVLEEQCMGDNPYGSGKYKWTESDWRAEAKRILEGK